MGKITETIREISRWKPSRFLFQLAFWGGNLFVIAQIFFSGRIDYSYITKTDGSENIYPDTMALGAVLRGDYWITVNFNLRTLFLIFLVILMDIFFLGYIAFFKRQRKIFPDWVAAAVSLAVAGTILYAFMFLTMSFD